jgi:hypothetical protein
MLTLEGLAVAVTVWPQRATAEIAERKIAFFTASLSAKNE